MQSHSSMASVNKLGTSQQQDPTLTKSKVQKVHRLIATSVPQLRNKASVSKYNKIIPKYAAEEPQKMYTQNLQLRDKLKIMEDTNMKLKAKIIRIEKEKQLASEELQNSKNYFSIYRNQKKQTSLQQRKVSNKHVEQNRRILMDYRQKIQKLTDENMKLKKSIKYVEIKELQIENNHLHEEMRRLKHIMVEIQKQFQQNAQNQKNLQSLHYQLERQKDAARAFHLQIKNKDSSIEDLQEKLKSIATRKSQLQKKYTRETATLKRELQYSKEKQKQRQFQIINQKHKQVSCKKCPVHQQQKKQIKLYNENLQRRVNSQLSEINQLKSMIESLNVENSMIKERQQSLLKQMDNQSEAKVEEVKHYEKKQIQQEQENNDEEQYSEIKSQQLEEIHLESKNQNKETKAKEIKDKSGDTEDLIQDLESEEQIIFQKEETQKEIPKKEDSKVQKKSEKKKLSNVKEEHMKESVEKQKKDKKKQKILKETITYRLMYHRYTYQNFEKDIKESNQRQFNIEEMFEMLSQEPFQLTEEQTQMVIDHCFGGEPIVSMKKFLKKMKAFIGQIDLLSETEEDKMREKIKKIFSKKYKSLNSQCKALSKKGVLSKKDFVAILKTVGGMNDEEIDCCLSEAVIISMDIAHIDYESFLNKMYS